MRSIETVGNEKTDFGRAKLRELSGIGKRDMEAENMGILSLLTLERKLNMDS